MKQISNSDLTLIVQLFSTMSKALRSDNSRKVVNACRRAKLLTDKLNRKLNEKEKSKDTYPQPR